MGIERFNKLFEMIEIDNKEMTEDDVQEVVDAYLQGIVSAKEEVYMSGVKSFIEKRGGGRGEKGKRIKKIYRSRHKISEANNIRRKDSASFGEE